MGSRRPVARRNMLQEAEERRRRMLLRIDAALARIEDGRFGYCAICGGPIAAARLDREPVVTTCADCEHGRN